MTNKKGIFLIFSILLVFGILVVFIFDVNCVFKSITNIPCPGCGLTRGFRSLFQGNIIKAEGYNILTVPIFIFLMISLLLFLVDVFKKSNKLDKFLKSISNHYILIIILIIISWIINIINGI